MSATAGAATRTAPAAAPARRGRPRPGFRHALAAILVIALAARLAIVFTTPGFRPHTDAADYDRIAVSLAADGRFPDSLLAPGSPTAFRPPLFPVVLAGAYKVVGVGSASTRWEAGRVLEAILGTIAVALTALIALRLWGRRAALLSGLIAALYPPLVLVGSSLMSEALYVPLVLAAVLAALATRGSPRPARLALLTGVLVGLAALTRSNGIALALPVAALVWTGRPWRAWPSVRVPLLVVLATGLTLVPWTIRNEHAFGRFVPISTESGYATAGTYDRYAAARRDFPAFWYPPVLQVQQLLARDPHLNEAELSNRLDSNALDYVGRHPAYPLKVAYWNTLRLLGLTGTGIERWAARYESYPEWLSSLSMYVFWVVGAIGLLGILLRAGRGAPWAFWACPVVIFLSSVLFIGATRYRAPADPFLVILVALSCWRLWPRHVPVGSSAA